MKLIPMTDFVLEQSKSNGYDITDEDLIIRVINYARFLKQPLKLEMFVPCDKDANVLEEPTMEKYGWYSANHQEEQSGWMYEEGESEYNKAISKYRKSKAKVLFEGFEVKGNYIMYYDFAYMMKYELEGKTVENIIDEIPNNSLQLTQNAIKQFL